MDEYEKILEPILKELVSKYGIDSTIDFVGGMIENIDFELFKNESKENK